MSIKLKRGDCGTCHWFEAFPTEMQKQPIRHGFCLGGLPVPVPQQQMVGSVLAPEKMQVVTSAAGMRPPTTENSRCPQWRPMGTQPPYDDMIRPNAPKEEYKEDLKQ